jgi:predicted DsbA family dithiol-disulfide isomerase
MKSFSRASMFCLIVAALSSFHLYLHGKEQKVAGKSLASVNGAAITEAQVLKESTDDLDSLELQKLRSEAGFARKRHDILEQSLNRLVEGKLLKAEAAKRGITEAELIESEITKLVKEPTNEQIDAFYEGNKDNIRKPKEQVVEKIRQYLRNDQKNDIREAFLKKLEKEHRVARSLEPLRFKVSTQGCPSKGPAAAPVTLVLFSDFQCPYCRDFNLTIEDILKKYGDKVRLVFRQLPLTNIHANAQRAAAASLCAAAQNHFWEMHDNLFRHQDKLAEENIKGWAKDLNLDANAFSSCLGSERIRTTIKDDVRAGSMAGADGTPTLFINGRYLGGARSFEEIAAVIDEELPRK